MSPAWIGHNSAKVQNKKGRIEFNLYYLCVLKPINRNILSSKKT